MNESNGKEWRTYLVLVLALSVLQTVLSLFGVFGADPINVAPIAATGWMLLAGMTIRMIVQSKRANRR